MSSFFSNFGIEWKILAAQIVNFAVLFWVLKRYAFKPIFDMLERRRDIVLRGLNDAKDAEANLSQSRNTSRELISEAKTEARSIVLTAHNEGKDIVVRATKEGQDKKAEIIEHSSHEIEEQRKKAEIEMLKKTTDHVMSMAKKMLGSEMTSEINNRMIGNLSKNI